MHFGISELISISLWENQGSERGSDWPKVIQSAVTMYVQVPAPQITLPSALSPGQFHAWGKRRAQLTVSQGDYKILRGLVPSQSRREMRTL
jgi:hypothetical protein